jgi:integrase
LILHTTPKASARSTTRLALGGYATPRQRTWQQTERILKSAGDGWINRPIADITKGHAQKLIDQWIADGQPYKAKLAASWWRTMWKWAWKREFVVAPVMDALEVEFARRVRDRVYSDDEIRTIWSAADSIDPVRGAFFKLLLLLGPRKSALWQMRWSDVKSDVWITPFEHTKSRKTMSPRTYMTPLPPLAQRILKGLPRVDGDDRVFAGMSAPRTKLVQQLIRHGAPSDYGYHTCRHTIASWLQDHGHSQYEVGVVLNHSNAGVTSGYSHGYPTELKLKLLTRWSDHIAGLVQPAGVTVLR